MKAALHAARWTAGAVLATSCGCSLLVAPAARADTESGSGGAAKSPVSSLSRAASKTLSKSASQSLSGSVTQTRSAAAAVSKTVAAALAEGDSALDNAVRRSTHGSTAALGHAGTAAGAVSASAGKVVTRTVVITREALAAAGNLAGEPADPVDPAPADEVAAPARPVPVALLAAPAAAPPAPPAGMTVPLAPPAPSIAIVALARPAESTIAQQRMSAPVDVPIIRPARGFADAVRALIGGKSLRDLVRDAAPGLIALLCAVTAGMRMQSGRWLPLRR